MYLDTVVQQAERRDKSYICTIEEYMASRRYNVGFDPSAVLIEICLELDIPHDVMQHPALVALLDAAANMVTLENVSQCRIVMRKFADTIGTRMHIRIGKKSYKTMPTTTSLLSLWRIRS